MNIKGGCQCGAIEFEVTPPFDEFSYCYCKRCRKATGSGRSAVIATSPEQLVWTRGENKLRRWDLPTAGSFATSFCPECGSPLPRLTRSGNHAIVPAGSIDSDIPVEPVYHEYLGSRANWVCLDDSSLKTFDGEPG